MPITNKTKIRLWNPEKSNSFIENIDMSELFRIDSNLSSLITKTDLQQHELDNIIMKINQLFEKCAEMSFGHTKETSKTKDTNMTKKPWFHESCHRARNQYHNARRVYNINRTEQNKDNLRQSSKFYKSTMNLSVKNIKMYEFRN